MTMTAITTLPKPCQACPWKIDAKASDIPHFDMALAKKLAHTCPDQNDFGPDFDAALFACHASKEGEDFPCAGWLAVVGHRHPRVRLALHFRKLDESALTPGDDWPPLHQSYQEVLHKLESTLIDDAEV